MSGLEWSGLVAESTLDSGLFFFWWIMSSHIIGRHRPSHRIASHVRFRPSAARGFLRLIRRGFLFFCEMMFRTRILLQSGGKLFPLLRKSVDIVMLNMTPERCRVARVAV